MLCCEDDGSEELQLNVMDVEVPTRKAVLDSMLSLVQLAVEADPMLSQYLFTRVICRLYAVTVIHQACLVEYLRSFAP